MVSFGAMSYIYKAKYHISGLIRVLKQDNNWYEFALVWDF